MALSSAPSSVAIIGAGLSGLSLGLVLHAHSIPCTIYESRNEVYDQGGAIMLSPNALRILDSLGVYKRIKTKGYSFEQLTFKDDAGRTKGAYFFGDEVRYGYKALRVYRHIILKEMTDMIKECGVPITFNAKFTSILREVNDEIVFEFEDGSSRSASLLIGADGIHSKVRKFISPELDPSYGGVVAITSSIPTSHLRFPDAEYMLPVTISATPGAFVIAPQDAHAEEVLIGTQRVYQERSRAGWDSLRADKDQLLEMMQKDISEWPDIAKSALEGVNKDKISIWPFYNIPRLTKWYSSNGRVIILGDAAHAVPPTTGQGVNQAFEDTYTLGLLLSKLSPTSPLSACLEFWQNWRQERIDKILDLTRKMNNKRLLPAEQAKLAKEEIWENKEDPREEMRWLYQPHLDEVVLSFFEGRAKNGDTL